MPITFRKLEDNLGLNFHNTPDIYPPLFGSSTFPLSNKFFFAFLPFSFADHITNNKII